MKFSFLSHNHSIIFVVEMSLPLRITFEHSDYTYRVLTTGINRNTNEIKISLSGREFTLVRNNLNEWYAQDATIGDNHDLLKSIGRSVASRYRL